MGWLKGINHEPLLKLIQFLQDHDLLSSGFRGALGKLHAKEEAAGKVRIFAMVDAITQ